MTYTVAALGALALYLALPRGRASHRTAGFVFGVASMAGLLTVLRYGLGDPAASNLYFLILSFLTVGGAVRVVTHPKPVYSALYFVMVVLATAALAVLAGAEFLAAALVIVYAGAILVTYVFVIMLAQQSESAAGALTYDTTAREPGWSVVAGFVLVATLAGVILERPWPAAEGEAGVAASNALSIGREVLTRYAVSLELAGVLLLVAMIGALAIARKPVPTDEVPPPDETAPPGETGRRVRPF
ncbi:MAG: NADH-quinone oxidoreductase subunit J [Phycisphaerae bacterium]|nr:NADH-quinone oxidoreductase subunit J [Phycisphaerae bacterium]